MARGFMLFELILVITILLICCGIGFVNYSDMKGTSFKSDAAMMSLLLRNACARAIATKKEQKIILDVSGCALVYDGLTYALGSSLFFGALSGTLGPPSAPKNVVSQPTTFHNNTIRIHPDGVIQAGTVYITDGKKAQYALTTPVSAYSFVRAYSYQNSLWHALF